MSKPKALVTNDDGIDDFFIKVLVEAMVEKFAVSVAAPATDQSWISRSISRNRSVKAIPYKGFNCPAWSVAGTPSDCVNIALGHLLPEKPDVVVSGINVGYNTTIPLILISGTVAGALEGAHWGIPSMAVSQLVPNKIFEDIKLRRRSVDGELKKSLLISAQRSTEMALELVGQKVEEPIVHNVNFPIPVTAETPIVKTEPGNLYVGSLFEKRDDDTFVFAYPDEISRSCGENTDLVCLGRGQISYTVLNYSNIGKL